jgi:quinol monooxygenase YgiN
MYGLITNIKTLPGRREAFAAMLLGATGAMAGCLQYVGGAGLPPA